MQRLRAAQGAEGWSETGQAERDTIKKGSRRLRTRRDRGRALTQGYRRQTVGRENSWGGCRGQQKNNDRWTQGKLPSRERIPFALFATGGGLGGIGGGHKTRASHPRSQWAFGQPGQRTGKKTLNAYGTEGPMERAQRLAAAGGGPRRVHLWRRREKLARARGMVGRSRQRRGAPRRDRTLDEGRGHKCAREEGRADTRIS